jgi:hypothetical protein
MFRNIMNNLATWYEVGENRAALIRGGKFVGKTWAAIDFATGFFDEYILIDLNDYAEFSQYISKERKSEKLHAKLTTTLDKYDFAGKLLIFDNIQVCPMAVTNLAAYAKFMSQCRICMIATATCALPGEEECKGDIDVYEMVPMTFDEFLKAGKGRKLCKYIENQRLSSIPDEVRASIDTMLDAFIITGGMPEAVNAYYKTEDYAEVDKVLKSILDRISEYIIRVTPKRMLTKVMLIWNSIPAQLTKDNKKFMYGYVDPKARAREYEASVNFLVSTGTVRQIYRIKHGIVPLSEQRDEKSFELYHLDHGLLRIMAGIHYTDIDMDNVLDTLDGMLAEQYALAELYSNRNVGTLYFWISSATAKVDFVYESEGEIIPVDVQTDPHTKAQSVKVFKQRYNNSTSIRISTDDMYVNSGLVNVPLYGIWNF